MRKPYILLISLVITLAIANGYFNHFSQPIPAKEKYDALVRLVDDQGNTFCSGTVISDTKIVTAAHCLMSESAMGLVGIRNDDNIDHKVFASPYKALSRLDTGVLVGNFKGFKHTDYLTDVKRLNDKTGVAGATFRSCGFPLGGNKYCTTLTFRKTYTFLWSSRGAILPGMSGGPVLVVDMMGNETLVAVNSAMDEDLAIIAPIYNLDDWSK